MNDGYPVNQPYSRAGLLAKLTGAAVLAVGALLYGQGTSQIATLTLGTAGRVLVAGATAPAWSDAGFSYASGVLAIAGSASGTPSAGQVLIGGGAIKVGGSTYLEGLTFLGATGGKRIEFTPASGVVEFYDRGASAYFAARYIASSHSFEQGGITCTTLTTTATSGNAVVLAGDGNAGSTSVGSLLGSLIRHRRYGYSTGYSAVQVGDASRGLGFGLDPNTVAGGSFIGNNQDFFFTRGVVLRTPDSAGTNWAPALRIIGGHDGQADANATLTINMSVAEIRGTSGGTPGAGEVFIGGGQGKFGAGISCTTFAATGVSSFTKASNAYVLSIYNTNPTTAPGLYLQAGRDASDTALLIQNAADTVSLLRIKGDGAAIFTSGISCAGITTTVAGIAATFDSGAASDARLEFKRNGVRQGLFSWDTSVLRFEGDATAGSSIYFKAGGGDRLTIASGGTVTVTSTNDGSLTCNGRITAKVAVPGSFDSSSLANLAAAVQSYLVSILT